MMPEERYIELDVTYKCSAQCQHCIFASSPRKGGLMPVEDARTYLAEQPQLVQDLVARGPSAMLDMAEKHGFRPRDRYVSKCHLCWDIREAIHRHYPDLFAPAELYWD